MKTKLASLAISFLIASLGLQSFAFEIQNFSDLSQQLGFTKYYSQTKSKTLKVAILDNGFDGYEAALGKSLPANTVFNAGPQPTDISKNPHGLAMAEILTYFTTNGYKNWDLAPQILLYNSSGFKNFGAAVDDVVRQKVDIVLYSQVWAYGTNYDGTGLIDATINKATSQGIIWVNAAGNYAQSTFNSHIQKVTGTDWLQLPGRDQSIEITCQPEKDTQTNICHLKITLSWNDFKNKEGLGTDKDLDFEITDDMGNVVVDKNHRDSEGNFLVLRSQKIQTSDVARMNTDPDGLTLYPREIIIGDLKKGTYFVKVKQMSDNFTSKDMFRLTSDSQSIRFLQTDENESLNAAADNASVITVGAADDEMSSRSKKLNKPELFAPSILKIKDEVLMKKSPTDTVWGSSNAAAIAAAGIVLMKEVKPTYSKTEILKMISNANANQVESQGRPLDVLGFQKPADMDCFPALSTKNLGPVALEFIRQTRAVLVDTDRGPKFIIPMDPVDLSPTISRTFEDDVIVLTARGLAIDRRKNDDGLAKAGNLEVFQLPQNEKLCQPPAQWKLQQALTPFAAKSFYLP